MISTDNKNKIDEQY